MLTAADRLRHFLQGACAITLFPESYRRAARALTDDAQRMADAGADWEEVFKMIVAWRTLGLVTLLGIYLACLGPATGLLSTPPREWGVRVALAVAPFVIHGLLLAGVARLPLKP